MSRSPCATAAACDIILFLFSCYWLSFPKKIKEFFHVVCGVESENFCPLKLFVVCPSVPYVWFYPSIHLSVKCSFFFRGHLKFNKLSRRIYVE